MAFMTEGETLSMVEEAEARDELWLPRAANEH